MAGMETLKFLLDAAIVDGSQPYDQNCDAGQFMQAPNRHSEAI